MLSAWLQDLLVLLYFPVINTIQVTDTLEVRLTMAMSESMDTLQKLPIQLGAEPRKTRLDLVPLNYYTGCDKHACIQYQGENLGTWCWLSHDGQQLFHPVTTVVKL